MSIIQKTFQYGDFNVTLETGAIAKQADGAVLISMGDTVVLVTVVGIKTAVEGRDFVPLTVHYQERSYAAGKVPGGYFKREGRPSEKEILTSRLIDRPLRPLFPEGFTNEVQIIATVLSVDAEIDSDIPSILGASAALAVSGIPFSGPVGAVRVGYKDGIFLLNPSVSQLKESKLDLVVAGSHSAVLMVESEADELSEDVMASAVLFGHEQMQIAIKAIAEFAKEAGSQSWNWQPSKKNDLLLQKIKNLVEADLINAYQISDKLARQNQISELRNKCIESLITPENIEFTEEQIKSEFNNLEKNIVRGRILSGLPRIDGRDTKTVRPITIETGVLPRTHGSVVFTRGETQALVITTLGTERDAQTIDALMGESVDRFMLHYNFPPYCVGETGMVGSPKRREIGHGKLAKRAMQAVLPSQEEFPYVLRVVSEITESNGSSSMATVCGTSLALMDTGVPIKAQVAGVAMGLIKEGNQYAVLTDILGDEDHLGDMDFKVAGTSKGVTALQMDMKIEGITTEIMQTAIAQAKEARVHILNIMDQTISKPRTELSIYAPRIITMKIPKDKIGNVIGKGGATIRELTEATGATIDINDEGIIKIAAVGSKNCEEAHNRIENLIADIEVGRIYQGKVIKIMEFGAFVSVVPGKDGLVHISQISEERVKDVNDFLKEGQIVTVKVIEVDRQGRIKLSMKETQQAQAEI